MNTKYPSASLKHFHKLDNVLICIENVDENYLLGKKYASKTIDEGEKIIKLGNQIGVAKKRIEEFEEIHEGNLTNMEDKSYNFNCEKIDSLSSKQNTFLGYDNPHHGVATRKCILVISLVSCANNAVRIIEEELKKKFNTDKNDLSIVGLIHSGGCGTDGSSDINLKLLQRSIEGYVLNPNCFGAIIIGLGCETNDYLESPAALKKVLYRDKIQSFSSFDNLTKDVLEKVSNKISPILDIKRKEFEVSNLKLAVQCGGSDGLSAATANPILGGAVDLLVEKSGIAILSETPETFGAHINLMERIKNTEMKNKFEQLLMNWKDGENTNQISQSQFNTDNPKLSVTLGNIEGGLNDIYEKSLGSFQKGGTSSIEEVLEYGELMSTKAGLKFMDSPGYDPCSITGQIASGANILCFTTGRGSSYDNSLLPVIKIASNKDLFERMPMFMDFDASRALYGETFSEVAISLYEMIIEKASGEATVGEAAPLRSSEFIPWTIGMV